MCLLNQSSHNYLQTTAASKEHTITSPWDRVVNQDNLYDSLNTVEDSSSDRVQPISTEETDGTPVSVQTADHYDRLSPLQRGMRMPRQHAGATRGQLQLTTDHDRLAHNHRGISATC